MTAECSRTAELAVGATAAVIQPAIGSGELALEPFWLLFCRGGAATAASAVAGRRAAVS